MTFALFSYTQQTLSRSAIRAVVLDKDGRPLHEHILTGKCIGEAFMLHNGDIILYTSDTLKNPRYSGASVQAVRLSGSDLSLLSQSESTQLQPYREIYLGKVGTDGIDITITKNVHDPSSETTGKRHYFLSIP
ncbi:MAG: hypothetical protein IKM31_08980 [Oscillospiraceae bacterium]|nr:hypothetical protein [Oscillospiraceae bacterium]